MSTKKTTPAKSPAKKPLSKKEILMPEATTKDIIEGLKVIGEIKRNGIEMMNRQIAQVDVQMKQRAQGYLEGKNINFEKYNIGFSPDGKKIVLTPKPPKKKE